MPRAARRLSRPTRPIRTRSPGFDVEIAELIAARLGRPPQFIQVAFQSLDQSARRGDFDIGLSGIEDIPARRQSLAASVPYYEFREVLTVREADRDRYRTLADLRGRRVATLGGTMAYDLLLEAEAQARHHRRVVRRRRASLFGPGQWPRRCRGARPRAGRARHAPQHGPDHASPTPSPPATTSSSPRQRTPRCATRWTRFSATPCATARWNGSFASGRCGTTTNQRSSLVSLAPLAPQAPQAP